MFENQIKLQTQDLKQGKNIFTAGHFYLLLIGQHILMPNSKTARRTIKSQFLAMPCSNVHRKMRFFRQLVFTMGGVCAFAQLGPNLLALCQQRVIKT